jgi:hypothetical protein
LPFFLAMPTHVTLENVTWTRVSANGIHGFSLEVWYSLLHLKVDCPQQEGFLNAWCLSPGEHSVLEPKIRLYPGTYEDSFLSWYQTPKKLVPRWAWHQIEAVHKVYMHEIWGILVHKKCYVQAKCMQISQNSPLCTGTYFIDRPKASAHRRQNSYHNLGEQTRWAYTCAYLMPSPLEFTPFQTIPPSRIANNAMVCK